MEALIKQLRPVLNSKVIYFKTVPEISDFTQRFSGKFEFTTSNTVVSLDNLRLNSLVSVLEWIKPIILTYDFKRFVSYTKYHYGDDVNFNNKILDIKIIESFLTGNSNKEPPSFKDAISRFKTFNESWKKLYKEIHYPLITEVIPALEAKRIIVGRGVKHTFYNIEGQKFGRLSTHKPNDSYIIPHTINDELASQIKPSGYGKEIFTFDYRHMEVSILQWLSHDVTLLEVMEKGDFYSSLYKDLFSKDCSDASRQRMKLIFLPLIYGSGANTLSGTTGIPVHTVEKVINLIKNRFKKLFEWVESQEVAVDYFGRTRNLEHKYLTRSFLVQSVAAMVCQHKLIQLFRKYNDILFSIHDGYVVQIPSRCINEISEGIIYTLEKEEKLYPGLRLKVAHHKGIK